MNSKISRFFLLVLFTVLVASCKVLTHEDVRKKDGFLSTPKSAKADCDAKFVIALPQDSTRYEFVGTCIAKKLARGRKNMALEKVNRCACHNQGDLVKIVSAKEFASVHGLSFGGMADVLNPNSPKYIDKDHVLAEVYKLKKAE